MPRRALLLLAAGTLTAIYLLLTAGAARAFVPAGSRLHGIEQEYLALGDSLATGVGSSKCPIGCAGKAGYVTEYARRLEFASGHAVSVRDLGVNGETTDSFIGDYFTSTASRSQLAHTVAEIRAHGRSISPVTLDIGGNDALNVRGSGQSQEEKLAALDDVRHNLERIISTVQAELAAAGSHADLVLLAYFEPYGQDDPEAWGLARLNQIIREAGAAHGLRIAEPFALFAGKERNNTWVSCRCIIDVHPNDRGYGMIAAELARVTYIPAATTGTIAGTVRDSGGRPVSGATVWYGGGVRQTDRSGRFGFEDVGAGAPLRFSAYNGATGEGGDATITAVAGQSTLRDLSLSPGHAGTDAGTGLARSNTPFGYGRIIAAVIEAGMHSAGQGAATTAARGAGAARQTTKDARSTAEQLASGAGDAIGGLVHRIGHP